MRIKGYSIAVNDIELSTAFYSEVLGLTAESIREGHVIFSEGVDLYSITRWSENIGKRVMDVYFGASSSAIIFETKDFDAFLSKAYRCEYAEIYAPLTVDKGLRVITLLDPDKNLVTVKEVIDNTVKVYPETELEKDAIFRTVQDSSFVFEKE